MRIGERIGDRYTVEALAGSGGMADVYRARDAHGGGLVAVKVLRTLAANQRFVREAELLRELDCDAVVGYLDHGVTAGGLGYLVMEWLAGHTLADRLVRGPLSVAEALAFVRAAAHALTAVHRRGIVHRDVKPSNLWLADGALARVKVLDFGIARLADAPALTAPNAIVGTPHYLSPEQARAASEVDARTDVFALGCVLYECLTGELAFPGDSLTAVLGKILFDQAPRVSARRDVPAAVDALVARMLARDPAARPADAAQLIGTIDALERDGEPPPASVALGPNERRVVIAMATSRHADLRCTELGQRIDVTLERLADGTWLSLAAADAPHELAERSARLALELAHRMPALRVAVCMGLAELGRAHPVGEVIDRVVALAGPSDAGVWVDEITASLLGHRFDLRRDAGERRLVAMRAHERRVAPFVGRARELDMLRALCDESATDRAPRVALIGAEAGGGKSRLLAELCSWLARERPDTLAIRAGGEPLAEGEPLALFARALCGVIRRDGPLDVFLAELCGVPVETPTPALLAARADPRLMRDQLLHACVECLRGASASRPLALVFDDLQFADRASVTFLERALAALPHAPIAVVGASRPAGVPAVASAFRRHGLVQLELRGLGAAAAEAVASHVLGTGASPDLVRELVALADGNPFVLEELARTAATGALDQGRVLVRTILQARFQELDEISRQLLRAAAVFGRTFTVPGVQALLGAGVPRATVDDRLDRLLAEDILVIVRDDVEGAARYAFRHDLLSEAAYEMLTEADRWLGHARAAAWLEASGDRQAALLARHWELGGKPERARGQHARAAAGALQRGDYTAAIAHVEHAVRCGADGDGLGELLLLRAAAHRWRSEHEQALAATARAMACFDMNSARWYDAVAQRVLAERYAGGDAPTSRLLASHAGDEFGDAETRTSFLRAAAEATLHLLVRDDVPNADALFDAIERHLPVEPLAPAVVARIDAARARRASRSGQLERALRLNLSTLARQCETGDLADLANQQVVVGYLHMRLGAYERGEEHLRDALGLAVELTLPNVLAMAQSNLGLLCAFTGRYEEGLAFELAALPELLRSGARMAASGHTYLARIHALGGALDESERAAREATRLEVPATVAAYAHGALAATLLARARTGEALEAGERAVRLLEESTMIGEGDMLARAAHAAALAACGRRDAARELVLAAHEQLLARAATIEDDELRRSFLEREPENRWMCELAAELGRDP